MFDEDLFKLDTSVVPSAIRYLKESKQNIYIVKSCYQHVLEVYCCSYPNNNLHYLYYSVNNYMY